MKWIKATRSQPGVSFVVMVFPLGARHLHIILRSQRSHWTELGGSLHRPRPWPMVSLWIIWMSRLNQTLGITKHDSNEKNTVHQEWHLIGQKWNFIYSLSTITSAGVTESWKKDELQKNTLVYVFYSPSSSGRLDREPQSERLSSSVKE